MKQNARASRFDIAICNPPYKANMHLDVSERVISNSEETIVISPFTWAQPRNRWNSQFCRRKDDKVAHPVKIEKFSHRESNDIFGTGNSNEVIAICKYNSKDEKIDLLHYELDDKMFSIYEKILKQRIDKKRWLSNDYVKNFPEKSEYEVPIFLWHGGDNCYEAALGNTKRNFVAQFDTKEELDNFKNSFKTTFMNFYFKEICEKGDCKLNVTMFVLDDYTQPWTDERFREYFNITDEEWEEILKTMSKYK